MFDVNDTLMYGSFGVCRVEAIEMRDFMGAEREYYVLRHLFSPNNTFYVPVDSETAVGQLHTVCSKKTAEELIGQIRSEAPRWTADDAARKAEYSRIIDSADRLEMLRQMKALLLHRRELTENGKKLHSSDERFLSIAGNILSEEFAYALGTDRSEALRYIEEHLV